MRSLICFLVVLGMAPSSSWGASLIDQINAAADQGKTVYIMFYRSNTTATNRMAGTVQSHVSATPDQTAWVKVNVNDSSATRIIQKFDAKRIALPAVFGLAPNGAVTGTHQGNVSLQQLQQSLLTPKHADVVKALQGQKIAVLCLMPDANTAVPAGVTQFESEPAFQGKIVRVTASATDAAEMDLFQRMKVDPSTPSPVVVAFAPPGIYLGKFDANVAGATLSQKVHQSGGCNCEKCQTNR